MEKPILPSPHSMVEGWDGDPQCQACGVSPHSSRVHPDLCCHMASAHRPGVLGAWSWLEVMQVLPERGAYGQAAAELFKASP